MHNYAVIPTYNRPRELSRLVSQLSEIDVACIIIDNGSNPPAIDQLDNAHTVLSLSVKTKPPRLYYMWNLGLTIAEDDAIGHGETEWNVAILNDDAIIPAGWWDIVEENLRGQHGPYGSVEPWVASTHQCNPIDERIIHTKPNTNVFNRMCPWAFMMRGETGLLADPTFKWWWGDTDFEWQASCEGGVVIAPGPVVINEFANQSTQGELAVQAGLDREAFARKWGKCPW